MKLNLFITAMFLALSANLDAQWLEQDSKTHNTLWDCDFVSETVGYVVGGFGNVLRTTDGGDHWELLSVGSMWSLFSVDFINDSVGFAVGEFRIYKTTNYGQTWSQSAIGTNWLKAVHFVDADNGFTVGYNGYFRKTTNGGSFWTFRQTNTKKTLNALYFFDANEGIAVGHDGIIIRTIDAGVNWTHDTTTTNTTLRAIIFIDNMIGFIGGDDGLIMKTSDGGITWKDVQSNTSQTIMGFAYDGFSITHSVGDSTALQTTDDGETWHHEWNTQSDLGMQTSNCFPTVNIGYMVGTNGKIYKTTNAGGTVGVKDITPNADNTITVYPNPSSGELFIEFDVPGADLSLKYPDLNFELFNFVGQKVSQQIEWEVKQYNDDGIVLHLNTRNLPIGLYFLTLVHESNFLWSRKIVIR
ncbi:MAG: hypothetical protein IIA45_12840 [Bacteroidetes bacterium]|nr:hypothetical protein [Bacteroidota bacterium]